MMRLTFPMVAAAAALAGAFAAQIPRVWDDDALASMEVPLAVPEASPRHVSSEYYYRIPVRPVYRSYPIYAPDREPEGYMDWLRRQEPEIAFDPAQLQTDDDWIRAGQLVFEAPIGFGATFRLSQVRDPGWHQSLGVPAAADGTIPFARYVIRRKGDVEVGTGSCAMCHTRVLPDGFAIMGAQGNFPVDRAIGLNLRAQAATAQDSQRFLEDIRLGQRLFFSVPWLDPDPFNRIDSMSLDDIAGAYEAVPPGVTTRVNLSLFTPAQIPDLIGVCDLRHLDHTGIVEQRSIADLMRYAALVQGGNFLDRFGDFSMFASFPEPETLQRYSDEQLYALSLFLCSLQPPPNPNPFDETAERGRAIFEQEGCIQCHTPPLYTNNKLVPAEGFRVPPGSRERHDILEIPVGTDPALALRTRKGTGYYKVPSLRGVWYRGPFEHSGSVLTLEDWFDPRRLQADYMRTGFGADASSGGAVKGHPFGLDLADEEKKALIAFLKTL